VIHWFQLESRGVDSYEQGIKDIFHIKYDDTKAEIPKGAQKLNLQLLQELKLQ
jgi:hypothetical protein